MKFGRIRAVLHHTSTQRLLESNLKTNTKVVEVLIIMKQMSSRVLCRYRLTRRPTHTTTRNPSFLRDLQNNYCSIREVKTSLTINYKSVSPST